MNNIKTFVSIHIHFFLSVSHSRRSQKRISILRASPPKKCLKKSTSIKNLASPFQDRSFSCCEKLVDEVEKKRETRDRRKSAAVDEVGQRVDDDRDSSSGQTKARSCDEREGRGKAGRTGWLGFVSRVAKRKEKKRDALSPHLSKIRLEDQCRPPFRLFSCSRFCWSRRRRRRKPAN